MKAKPHITTYGRCETTGKVKHRSKADAKQAKIRITTKGGHDILSVFKCKDCNYFHVGSKTIHGNVRARVEHNEVHINKLFDKRKEE